MTGQTLVVGDIQGCADELELLLESVGFAAGRDRIVSVGDIVNRGPRSLAALRQLRDLGADVVLGNHERYLLAVLAGRQRYEDTLDELIAADDLPELLDWLIDRPEPLIIVRDWIVVHAGLPPGFEVADAAARNANAREAWRSPGTLAERAERITASPALRFVTVVRYCNEAGEMPPDAEALDPPGYPPWFEYWPPTAPIVAFGHWARLEPMRAERQNLRFLDTGCVYGRELTGWLVEEDRLVSVPARQVYWPR